MKTNIKKFLVLSIFISIIFAVSSCSWEKGEKNYKETWVEINQEQRSEVKMWMDDNEVKKNDIKDEKIKQTSWVYTEYTPEKLASSTWNIVLFFHASWCPPCKTAHKNFSWENTPENLTILKIDYDNSTELKKKYWVTSQHTFVQVDNNWNMIKKWGISKTYDSILKNIEVQEVVEKIIEETVEKNVNEESEEKTENEWITLEEVAKHSSSSDCYTVIDGSVYDVTNFFGKHPGWDKNLAKTCWIDATELFNNAHWKDEKAKIKKEDFLIWKLR